MNHNETDNLLVKEQLVKCANQEKSVSTNASLSTSSAACAANTNETNDDEQQMPTTAQAVRFSNSTKKSNENIYLLKSDNVFCFNSINYTLKSSTSKPSSCSSSKSSSVLHSSTLHVDDELKTEDSKLNYNLESLNLNWHLEKNSNEFNKQAILSLNRSFKHFITPKTFSSLLLSSSSTSSSSASSSSSLFNLVNSDLNASDKTPLFPLAASNSTLTSLKNATTNYNYQEFYDNNNNNKSNQIDSILLDERLKSKSYKKIYNNFIAAQVKIDKPSTCSMKSFIDDSTSQTIESKDSQLSCKENSLELTGSDANNEDTNSLYSSSSSSSVPPQVRESPPLKRTHAITDLHSMDDYSPVTFDTQASNKSDEAVNEENSAKVDYIEETKEIMPGIKVRAAKLPKLIEVLVESFTESGELIPNTDFPRVFFLMHKWFMESEVLVDMLSDLYLKYEDNQKPHSIGYQLKICHAFRYWINTFTFHFVLDNVLIESIRRFSNLVSSNGHKDQLQFFDISNIDSYDWMRKLTTKNPLKSKQKIPLGFDKITPEVLANQLTFLEWKTLRRISFSDYKSYAIKASIHDIPPLERSIQLFNGLSQWIQCMVLSKTTPRQRADIIHKFIEVAQHLRQLQNFNSLMAVIGGICHSALARLSKTNLYLSVEDQKVLSDFMELLSSNCNYGQYRKTISEIHDFWIPIIGIHLKDMISLHTAHKDVDNDLINFRKMAKLSIIFQSITNLQNSVPPVQENRDLIKLLQLSLDMSYSEDEIYGLSLAREPRTSVSSPSTPSRISAFADWAKSISTPPDPQTIQKHVNAMVDAVFKNYDHDRDGFISQAEFYEIAQNFPFIDTFAVLDADKDGMISGEEMKSYFLKANYHALKTEFKHEFHETTYFKPTFCNLCDGFLWGLIKQGWKCKDCGINAHRVCKDRIVIECRSKRNFSIHRQTSNSISETSRNRSTSTRLSTREHPKVKQKATQTDNYDDLFMSDDSMTSNEDTYNNNKSNNTLYTSSTLIDNENEWNFDDDMSAKRSSTINSRNDSISQSQRGNRRRSHNKQKSPKRRKSLPSQCSLIVEPHTSVTLIPRGPLICSNSENLESWLPERLFLNNKSTNPIEESNSNLSTSIVSTNKSASTSPCIGTKLNNAKLDLINKINEVKVTDSSATDMVKTDLESKQILTPKLTVTSTLNNNNNNNNNNKLTNSAKPFTKISTYASIIDSNKKFEKKNSESFISTKPNGLVNYESKQSPLLSPRPIQPKLIPRPIETIAFKPSRLELISVKSPTSIVKSPARVRIESECSINDLIEGYHSDNLNESLYSSNDEDNDVFIKLKEAEKEKEKLAKENAKIKQELESAKTQLSTLKEKMSSIKIIEKIDLNDDKTNDSNAKKDSDA